MLTKLTCRIKIIVCLLAITVFSGAGTCMHQAKARDIYLHPPSFTKVGIATWGAGGAYVAEEGYPTAAFTNPAGLNGEKTTFYAEVGKRSAVADRVHWLIETKWDGQFILPGFASMMKPVGDLTLSIGYMNYYDLSMNIDSIEVTTSEDPEGLGEFYGIEENLRIHTFYGAGSYHFADGASVGLTLGLNYLKYRDEIAELSGDGHGLGIQFIAGGLLSPFENLNIGATFRYSTKIEYDMQYHSNDLNFEGDSLNEDVPPAHYKPEPASFMTKFPWSLQVGASYSPIADVKVLGMLDFQKWSIISDGYGDKIQVHFGTEISSLEPITFSLGFFTQDDPSVYVGKYLNQKFVTAGVRLKLWDSLELSTSFVDSHLFPNKEVEKYFGKDAKQFHQSYIATGVTISF